MKKIAKLKIPEELKEELINQDKIGRRLYKIGMTIKKVDQDVITVAVVQLEKLTNKTLSGKELHEYGKSKLESLKRYGYTLHFKPVTYKIRSEMDGIDSDWVRKQMQVHGVRQQQIANDLEIDKSKVSHLMNGNIGFTRCWKAAFYYYFKHLESKK